ncbi:MAG: OmpA family protein [Candidatus Omnitrophica bacterium]|nr:OmpA family protein [Candidatus Omnitrophota bacterium]
MSPYSKKRRIAKSNIEQHASLEIESDAGGIASMQLYASIMTILMTFFIVIYTQCNHSQTKFKLAQSSLNRAFQTVGLTGSKDIISLIQSKKSPLGKDAEDPNRDLVMSITEIASALEEDFMGCSVDLQRFETTIIIPEGKLFKGEDVTLGKEARQILNNIIAYIKKDIYSQIVISGHYNSTMIDERTVESNRRDWMVSSLRAITVAQYFAKKDLEDKSMLAIGYGNHHPIAHDPYSDALVTDIEQNNRIEIVIQKPTIDSEDDFELVVS